MTIIFVVVVVVVGKSFPPKTVYTPYIIIIVSIFDDHTYDPRSGRLYSLRLLNTPSFFFIFVGRHRALFFLLLFLLSLLFSSFGLRRSVFYPDQEVSYVRTVSAFTYSTTGFWIRTCAQFSRRGGIAPFQ